MSLMKYDPFEVMFGQNSNIDSLFKVFDREFGNVKRNFVPSVNISEDDKVYYVTAELAGLTKDEIDISVKENVLTLEATRTNEHKVNENNDDIKTVRNEINYGKYSRTFTLPDNVDRDGISAEMKNGLLQIILKKKEEDKPKELKISIH